MVTNQQKIVMQKEKRNSSKGMRQEDSRAEKWTAVGVDYSLGVKSNWGKDIWYRFVAANLGGYLIYVQKSLTISGQRKLENNKQLAGLDLRTGLADNWSD